MEITVGIENAKVEETEKGVRLTVEDDDIEKVTMIAGELELNLKFESVEVAEKFVALLNARISEQKKKFQAAKRRTEKTEG